MACCGSGLPAGMPVEEAEGLLALDGETLFIEPNYIVNAFRTPNDPRYGELWGMARIDAPGAWDRMTGSADVIVAVIDTGLDYTHPDLRDRAWRNPGETAGNGIDDDHNGYVDDVYGWDFCNNDSNPMDDHGHGTHCGGTITGTGNNAVGVAGVTWNSRVMGLKFLCANGSGNTFAAALAVRYAADMRFALTSNSWGGGGFSQMLYDTILYAQSRDQLFVAAAGNDGLNIDATNSYPAGYDLPNIVTVAASDAADGSGELLELRRHPRRPRRAGRGDSVDAARQQRLRRLVGHLDGHAPRVRRARPVLRRAPRRHVVRCARRPARGGGSDGCLARRGRHGRPPERGPPARRRRPAAARAHERAGRRRRPGRPQGLLERPPATRR